MILERVSWFYPVLEGYESVLYLGEMAKSPMPFAGVGRGVGIPSVDWGWSSFIFRLPRVGDKVCVL